MTRTSTGRRLAAAAIGLALLGLPACAGTGGSGSSTTDKPLRVGFVNGNTIEFHTCLEKAVRATAEESGVQLVVANSTGDPGKELTNVENMITQRVDAIILQTVNVDAQLTGVTRAKAAGIPIFLTSVAAAPADQILGAVTTDLNAVGRLVGEWVAKDSGGAARVAVIGGAPGAASAPLTAGFRAAMPQADVVFEQPAFWQRAKAQEVADNLLQSHPDVQYVFVHNEDMAMGVLSALDAAGRKDIKVVSNNGTAQGLAAVTAGRISATVANSPDVEGAMAVRNLLTQLRTPDPATKVTKVPEMLVTKDNVAQAPTYCR